MTHRIDMDRPCPDCGRPIGDHRYMGEHEKPACPSPTYTGPLTRAEGETLWAACQRAHEDRVARMPDEKSALNTMHDAYTRLKDMGWRDATYCPKDGSHFQAIEAGSTGIHDCNYQGEWPNGSWWLYDGDIWPSRPILFRLYPEDQAKEDARREEARQRYAREVQSDS